MAEYVPPALAGKASEATIDQANIAMRAMPWYQDLIKSFGQDPNNVKLTKNQSQQVVKQAQAHGFVIDEGDMHVDESGNIDKKGHALRNTLIVAGLAGATIATMGAAGVFAGAAGAGAGVGAGAGAGAAAAGSVGAGTAAGLGGAALPGAMATLPALAGAGTTAGLTTAGTLGTAAKIGGMLSQGKGATGYLNTAGQVANMLGDYSQGRTAGRAAEAAAIQDQNRTALERFRAEMDAKKFALTAPATRATNSVRGDILANAQDVNIALPSTIPRTTISGGLRPSMFSDATRTLGRGMSADALAGQQSGADTLLPPTPLATPQAGRLDSILNTAATVGSLAGAIPYRQPGRIPKPGDPDYIPPTPQVRR